MVVISKRSLFLIICACGVADVFEDDFGELDDGADAGGDAHV